jgi:hypothetical protein
VIAKQARASKLINHDKDVHNKMTQELEEKFKKQEIIDQEKQVKVNEVCVQEWQLRIKAKEHLDRIKMKTKLFENLITQDGSYNLRPDRNEGNDRTNHDMYGRKGIYNHAYLNKNGSEDDLRGKENVKDLTGAAAIMKRLGEKDKRMSEIVKNKNW